MKTLFAALLIAVVSSTSATVAFANEFKSEIIGPLASPSPSPIAVPDNHVIRINGFTQSGGGTRGMIAVATTTGASFTTSTPIVLGASMTDSRSGVPLDPVNHLIIAGPATIFIIRSDMG